MRTTTKSHTCTMSAAQCPTPSTTTSGGTFNPFSIVQSIREYFLLNLSTKPIVQTSVTKINIFLSWAGVPQKSLLTNEEFVLSSTAVVVTLLGYYVLFGKRHRRKRKRLAEELRLAQKQVRYCFGVLFVIGCLYLVVYML